MDRFIDNFLPLKNEKTISLKSNMDRFIGLAVEKFCFYCWCLKSNMDRFIAQK